ncbi:MAG TPA: lipid A 3-O-deacylase, partial [Rhodanobacteraceae bacterium]|nr:lipid A 3-O-deacylase [Rhodanobacteraceae bacterium]
WWRPIPTGSSASNPQRPARTPTLSSGFEFMTSAGWQHGHFVVMLRHISNAHLFGGKNLGETMMLAGPRC